MPLLTLLMPVYNCAPYLHEAIESILNQTFSDFELMIINDCSTDNSENIILSYTDPRIRYLKNDTNKGLIYTLNKGLDIIKTKYIARMDGDDISLPTRLEKQVSFMEDNPEIGVCGTRLRRFDKKKQYYVPLAPEHHHIIRTHLFVHATMHHATVVFRKKVIDENKIRYNPEYRHAEDFELWTRLIDLTQFANIPEVLYLYRNTDNQVTKVFNTEKHVSADKIKLNQINKYFPDIPGNDKQEILEFFKQPCLTLADLKKHKKIRDKIIKFNNHYKAFNENIFNPMILYVFENTVKKYFISGCSKTICEIAFLFTLPSFYIRRFTFYQFLLIIKSYFRHYME